MSDFTISHRPGRGLGRGYAIGLGGRVLAWIDVQSGELSTLVPGSQGAAESLYLWRARHLQDAGVEAGNTLEQELLAAQPLAAEGPELPGDEGAPSWYDLAEQPPGELVSVRAAEEWDAARRRHPLLSIIARALGVHTEAAAWRKGAEGERRTGLLLERLGSHGWRALHSIPRGTSSADIDHLVIGPGGVFTINTKMHRGGRVWVGRWTVAVNGQKRPDYLHKARREAEFASRRLTRATRTPVDAFPVVVILCESMKIAQMPAGVSVMRGIDLRRWLEAQPTVLSPAQVDSIYQVARRSDTWL